MNIIEDEDFWFILFYAIRHRKWRSNKSSMRENETNYIDSSRLMIHLEEAFEEVRVRKCNQNNVKLYAVDGIEDEFFFFVEVIKMFDGPRSEC